MGTSHAQENKLLTAFTDSYAFETNLEYNKAANLLEKIYLNYISNYEINYRLGWLRYSAGDFKESENYYKKAMEIKPLSLEAIYGMILPLISQQKYNSVIKLSEKALSIAPNDSRGEYFLGLAYYYKKNYTKSEKFLEKAINKYPFDLDINLMLGWTKFALGKKNEAKSLFLTAQRNSPYNHRVKTALNLINK
jgi:tetratricopeptide (TPR) repeat protein